MLNSWGIGGRLGDCQNRAENKYNKALKKWRCMYNFQECRTIGGNTTLAFILWHTSTDEMNRFWSFSFTYFVGMWLFLFQNIVVWFQRLMLLFLIFKSTSLNLYSQICWCPVKIDSPNEVTFHSLINKCTHTTNDKFDIN